jgi:hypothetical protein
LNQLRRDAKKQECDKDCGDEQYSQQETIEQLEFHSL